jgi:thymidylate synthase
VVGGTGQAYGMRRAFEGTHLDDLLAAAYEAVLTDGDRVEATRGQFRELRGVQFELSDPRARLSRSWQRGRALTAVAEFVWYASGNDSVAAIERYIPRYKTMVGGGERAAGAYGPRLFGPSGQLESMVAMLSRSPSTRQAVVQLFNRDDLLNSHADVPCTCTLQFFVRDGLLELHVQMRSNDAVLGLPHDLFSFTMVQEWVAARLGYGLGPYVHTVGSFHIYEADVERVRSYLGEGLFEPRAMPPMPREDPASRLQDLVGVEARIRADTARAEELPDGYWGDLARLLWVQLIDAPQVGPSTGADQLRLASSFFDIYVQDESVRAARRERG